jgi:DNA (cytosine-5)-methyltransferase 1
MRNRKLPTISLFSGALGLDLGLEQAGFDIRVAVECDPHACETIRRNRPDITVIAKRIEDTTTEEILKAAKLKPGEPALVAGGPACQSFSTAGQRASLADPRGKLIREFLRVVEEAQPRFFLLENVRGLLSAAVRHRPLKKRGPGYPPLSRDEQLGSAFAAVLRELRHTQYDVVFDVLNAADFGVPQVRERVVFIGSRDGETVEMPSPTHSDTRTRGKRMWVTVGEAFAGLRDNDPEFRPLPDSKRQFLKMIPPGGNWRDLPEKLKAAALGKAHVSWGGRSGFYRRLALKRPSPALTTRPDSKATMLCHPTKLRSLTVREYACLQQFPTSWTFGGFIHHKYIQVGNAVPVGLGLALGKSIVAAMKKRTKGSAAGQIICRNADLLRRWLKRPSTILNPPRMRKHKTQEAAKKWKTRTKSFARERVLRSVIGSEFLKKRPAA